MDKIILIIKMNQKIINIKKNLARTYNYYLIIYLVLMNIFFSVISSMLYIINSMVKNNTGILNIIPPLAIMILMTVLSERHLNKFHKTELQITTIFKAIFTVFTAFFVHYTFKFIFEILYDITNNPKFKNLFHLFSSKINEYNTTQTYVLFSLILTLTPLILNFVLDLFKDNRVETHFYELIDSQSFTSDEFSNLELALKLKNIHSIPTQEEQKAFFNKITDIKLTKKNIEKILDLYKPLIKIRIINDQSIEYQMYEKYSIKLSENPENIIDEYKPRINISLQEL